MRDLFACSEFQGDISKWDVSNVTDMKNMFRSSHFNGDISEWDVSKVTDMYGMFYESHFNNDISKWDVSNVTDMEDMFKYSVFKQDISNWEINRNCDIKEMFSSCPMPIKYQPKITLKESFDFGSIDKQNKSINGTEVIVDYLIQHINNKDLTPDDYNILISYTAIYKVYDKIELKDLIKYAIKEFGADCNLNWIDVSNITDMSFLFKSDFNGDISKWNVSNVTNMNSMFFGSAFNGDISEWDVSNVTNMEEMFCCSYFNNDISKWNVSNVTSMKGMFSHSEFNGDISNWNIDKVNNMRNMFSGSKFNRDISNWNAERAYTYNMFDDCHIKAEYKPKNIYGY